MIELKELRSEYARYKFASAQERDECYEAWLSGDLVARNRLIEGSLFLIPSCIRQVLAKRPIEASQLEEYISIGLVTITEAVDKLREYERYENPFAFISQRLKWRFDQVPWEPLLPSCNQTLVKKHKNGNSTPPRCLLGVSPRHEAPDPFAEIEFVDWLLGQCRNDKERQFLRLKMAGYTTSEIADEMKCHQSTVYRCQARLYEHVMENYAEEVLK